MTNLVTLKNGSENIPLVAVQAIMLTIRSLQSESIGGLLTLIDLAETARTGQSQFNAARIEELGLTQNGRMHQVTRDVVLSAVVVHGTGMNSSVEIVSPLAT